jgi:hypothetical protein
MEAKIYVCVNAAVELLVKQPLISDCAKLSDTLRDVAPFVSDN